MSKEAVQIAVSLDFIKVYILVIGLFISSVTIQFKMADFINKTRNSAKKTIIGRHRFSLYFDWFWAYSLSIATGIVFTFISWELHSQIGDDQHTTILTMVKWLFLINVIFWSVGFLLDGSVMHKKFNDDEINEG